MSTIIDFRNINRGSRHAVFFSIFEALKDGASFEFINDHDPAPLYHQLQSMGISNLEWTYAEKGPLNWTIRITKKPLEAVPKEEGCCGICGGSDHKG